MAGETIRKEDTEEDAIDFVDRFLDAVSETSYEAGSLNYKTEDGYEVLLSEAEDEYHIIGDGPLVTRSSQILRSNHPYLSHWRQRIWYRVDNMKEEYGQI